MSILTSVLFASGLVQDTEHITAKTLDQKMNEALDNPVDHTYAIGLDGTKLETEPAPGTTTTEVDDSDDFAEVDLDNLEEIQDLYKCKSVVKVFMVANFIT